MLVTLIARNKSSLDNQLTSIIPLTVIEVERLVPQDQEGGGDYVPMRVQLRHSNSDSMDMQELK